MSRMHVHAWQVDANLVYMSCTNPQQNKYSLLIKNLNDPDAHGGQNTWRPCMYTTPRMAGLAGQLAQSRTL